MTERLKTCLSKHVSFSDVPFTQRQSQCNVLGESGCFAADDKRKHDTVIHTY